MGLFGNLFGKSVDFAALIAAGAQVVDVRNPEEFKRGHVKGSMNIPLGNIRAEATRLKKMGKPIIVCCASGMRSGNAKSILEAQGIEVYNGGSWNSVSRFV